MTECSIELGLGDKDRRLRLDLVDKFIRQLVHTVDGLHRAGVVHGNITTNSLFFSLPSEVHEWTDEKVYDVLGEIRSIPIVTEDGHLPVPILPPGVPVELILPTNYLRMMKLPSHVDESIVLGGLGQSYVFNGAIGNYTPRTPINYIAPETRFEKRAGFGADVWQLGCTIYEIRTGGPLFSLPFFSPSLALIQMVALLGRLPDPWWEQFEGRGLFTEEGRLKPDSVDLVEETSIPKLLTSIGRDVAHTGHRLFSYIPPDSIFDGTSGPLGNEEVKLLRDLLEKILTYKPEERIKLPEVMQHPYLTMCR